MIHGRRALRRTILYAHSRRYSPPPNPLSSMHGSLPPQLMHRHLPRAHFLPLTHPPPPTLLSHPSPPPHPPPPPRRPSAHSFFRRPSIPRATRSPSQMTRHRRDQLPSPRAHLRDLVLPGPMRRRCRAWPVATVRQLAPQHLPLRRRGHAPLWRTSRRWQTTTRMVWPGPEHAMFSRYCRRGS